jgi:hypothetical protein
VMRHSVSTLIHILPLWLFLPSKLTPASSCMLLEGKCLCMCVQFQLSPAHFTMSLSLSVSVSMSGGWLPTRRVGLDRVSASCRKRLAA